MGLLDIFSTSSKAVETASTIVDKTTTGIIAGIDKAFYTEEEKAVAGQKWLDSTMEFQKALMQEAMPSAVSRRVLAWIITGTYLLHITGASIIWRFNREWASFIVDNAVTRVEFAFSAVISTYFIYHGIKQIVKK